MDDRVRRLQQSGHTPADDSAYLLEDVVVLTIDELGWSREEAAAVRASLSAFAADWDHPSMAIYDGL